MSKTRLIRCEKCGQEVSSRAPACPHCGMTEFDPASWVTCVHCKDVRVLRDAPECSGCHSSHFDPANHFPCARCGQPVHEGASSCSYCGDRQPAAVQCMYCRDRGHAASFRDLDEARGVENSKVPHWCCLRCYSRLVEVPPSSVECPDCRKSQTVELDPQALLTRDWPTCQHCGNPELLKSHMPQCSKCGFTIVPWAHGLRRFRSRYGFMNDMKDVVHKWRAQELHPWCVSPTLDGSLGFEIQPFLLETRNVGVVMLLLALIPAFIAARMLSLALGPVDFMSGCLFALLAIWTGLMGVYWAVRWWRT